MVPKVDPEVLQSEFGVTFSFGMANFRKFAGEFLSELFQRIFPQMVRPRFSSVSGPPQNSRPEFTPRIVGIPLHFQIFEPTSISAYWGDRQTVFSVCLAIFLLKLTFCLTHSKRPKMGCSETVF